MLQQIFSEILNALNISVQERKCNLQSTVFSEEKYASKSFFINKIVALRNKRITKLLYKDIDINPKKLIQTNYIVFKMEWALQL